MNKNRKSSVKLRNKSRVPSSPLQGVVRLGRVQRNARAEQQVLIRHPACKDFWVSQRFIRRLFRSTVFRLSYYLVDAMNRLCRLSGITLDIQRIERACNSSKGSELIKAQIRKVTDLNVPSPQICQRIIPLVIKYTLRDLFGEVIPQLKTIVDVPKLWRQVNKTANFAVPYFDKKGNHEAAYLSLFSSFALGFNLKDIEDHCCYPAVIFTRVVVSDLNTLKLRVVSGVSGFAAACESRFTIAVSDLFKILGDKSSLIMGATQVTISRRVSRWTKYHVYCFDFSAFDARLNSFFIWYAFEILCMLFASEGSACQAYLRALGQKLISCPSWHPYCGVIKRQRGLASGSQFTSLVGGICNNLIIRYILCMIGENWKVFELVVSGDDSAMALTHPISVKRFCEHAERLGIKISKEKSRYSPPGTNEVEFLGSVWRDGKPERNLETMIAKTLYETGKPIINPEGKTAHCKGRFFSIAGHDHRLTFWWRLLGWGKLKGSKVTVYREALAWDQAKEIPKGHSEGVNILRASEFPWMER